LKTATPMLCTPVQMRSSRLFLDVIAFENSAKYGDTDAELNVVDDYVVGYRSTSAREEIARPYVTQKDRTASVFNGMSEI
jgi:hypothetical protein